MSIGNEERTVGEIVVTRVRIAGTRCLVYSAWEPSQDGTYHSTITHRGAVRYGRVGTRGIPAELDALPYGAERARRVRAWYDADYARAYPLIEAAFPEAALGERRGMGEIEVFVTGDPPIVSDATTP